MKRLICSITNVRESERGVALLMTVIVIMVLTTLGLAMVAFTMTEEKTATTYRDSLQTRAVAEAGVRIIEEALRDPSNRQLVPLFSSVAGNCTAGTADYCGTDEATTETSLNAKGIWRAARAGMAPARYTGPNNQMFVGPFQNSWAQTFGGTYSAVAANDVYDLKFNCTNPANAAAVVPTADCWLDSKFNTLLLGSTDWNLTTGRITDISLYAPPSNAGTSYGITTVRVTAVKTDGVGNILSRETVEAVIGDITPKPSILSNGNMTIDGGGAEACGDGCQHIHVNGDASITSSLSGGPDPILTVTGNISNSPGGGQANSTAVQSPKINPWDLAYKPTAAADLAKYYLLASRPLDAVWTDGTAVGNPAPRPCGVNNLSFCQDYNLAYSTTGVQRLRTAADVPAMYVWNAAASEWTLCTSGTTLSPPAGSACGAGAPTFTVAPANDQGVAGTGDDADLPFNVTVVPQTNFSISSAQDGSTVLIDGKFTKAGGIHSYHMTIISIGTQDWSTNTDWYPASATQRAMWISGRDINASSNCCAPSNQCATNLANTAAQGIIAAHEQMIIGSANTGVTGIVIAENKVNYDPTVGANPALLIHNGKTSYACGLPDWPWPMPTKPAIFSITTAAK